MKTETFERVLGATMAFFAALLLTVCPGGFLIFLLPLWLGFPLALACGVGGGLLMLKVSDDFNDTGFLRDREPRS